MTTCDFAIVLSFENNHSQKQGRTEEGANCKYKDILTISEHNDF